MNSHQLCGIWKWCFQKSFVSNILELKNKSYIAYKFDSVCDAHPTRFFVINMHLNKRKFFDAVLFALLMAIVGIIVFLPIWRERYQVYNDIDITTGRIRVTDYWFNFKQDQQITDSLLTKTIGSFPDTVQPQWRAVNRFVKGSHVSEHCLYHGAYSQIREVDLIWQLYPFTDDAKKYIAQTILNKWQADKNYFGVNDYLHKVSTIARNKTESDSTTVITIDDVLSIGNDNFIGAANQFIMMNSNHQQKNQ